MSSTTFFDSVSLFTDFHSVSRGELYTDVPENWWVIAADIKNSTEAIENGKYKNVNMAGASVIAAINNLFQNRIDLPYSFGGDGAVILVPDRRISDIKKVLNDCKYVVLREFGLELKAGLIPVRDIYKAGHLLRVAKLRLSDSAFITLFWGEGLPHAEEIIKSGETILEKERLQANFAGLECRWDKISPEHEEITSVIIKAASLSDKELYNIYDNCLKKIQTIYGSFESKSPLSVSKLSFAMSLQKLSAEWKIRCAHSGISGKIIYLLRLLFQQIAGAYLMNRKIATKNTDWGRYKQDLVKHADYHKFGDGLRFVISGTADQREKLEAFLQQQFKKGFLNFGVHSSSGLIITCLIKNHHREHVHFVDGADGGYAMAAKQMKQREKLKGVIP